MKLAAPYPLNEKRQNLIDEYNIDFILEKSKEEDLVNWIQKPAAQKKRINLHIISNSDDRRDMIDLDKLILMNNLHQDFYLRLSPWQYWLISFCRDNKIRFFFDYNYMVNSFCRLQDVVDLGVSDVYLTEDLCYNLPRAKAICDEAQIQTRIIINTIPTFSFGRGKDITSPWYVPENMPVLEDYYDVIEFSLLNSWNRFDVLYQIWMVEQKWEDSLEYINFDLEFDIPGEYFTNELCIYKMHCEHRCVSKGSSCRKCQQYWEIAKKIEKKIKNWAEDEKDEPIENIF